MEAMQQILAVGVVLGLLGATLWWLRRRGFALPVAARHSSGRRMECIERVALGPQQTLHLVRLGGRALLVASSPGGCSLLYNFAWQDVAAPRETSS